ncbi:hypothetical protein EW146_g549 [Bondarzewia mesenterica]|uniref:F-box domain-containing protein n=1 Tax=Bondarzewia mesenterica TaxID=1095465 RepID=A0A4S4M6J8_9AGAM|nr:hypothetical protein EW146_g549 [Bondarzewia mesenterica]
MHRCLDVPDILLEIIGHLLPPNDLEYSINGAAEPCPIVDAKAWQGAVALARVARSFMNPALDALWRVLPSPAHLLNCLVLSNTVSDCTSVLTCISSDQVYKNPPADDMWTRFYFYAPRIKNLWVNDDVAVAEFIFHQLSERRRAGPLLPNLKHLVWNIHDEAQRQRIFSCFSLFSSPSLEHLSINPSYLENGSVPPLSTAFPSLRELTVMLKTNDTYDNVHTEKLKPQVSELLLTSPPLTVLSVAVNLTAEALAHVSMMPQLQELDMLVSELDTRSIVSLASENSLFPALHTIDISDINLWASIGLFESFRERRDIERISVNCPNSWAPEGIMGHFCFVVSEHCSVDMLRDFDLSLNEFAEDFLDDQDPSEFPIYGIQELEPLFSFHRMEYFNFSYWKVDLDNSFLEAMPSSWPCLRHAHFWSVSKSLGLQEHAPRMTVDGLIHLAKHCPHLSYLHLDLALPSCWAAYGSFKRDWDHAQQISLPSLLLAIRLPTHHWDSSITRFLLEIFPNGQHD